MGFELMKDWELILHFKEVLPEGNKEVVQLPIYLKFCLLNLRHPFRNNP